MNSQVLKSKTDMVLFNLGRYKMTFIIAVLLGFGVAASAAEFVVDKTSSKVQWEAKKVTGKHNGSISFSSGSLMVADNSISGGSFVIDMKSIVDEDIADPGMKQKLIGHLSSDDFFSIANFPESKMTVKKVTPVAGNEYRILADLTIKGVTNPVEFSTKVSLNGDKLNAEGVITVNRTLYGIKYGSGSFFQGLGDKVIYDDFTLAFNLVAQKK